MGLSWVVRSKALDPPPPLTRVSKSLPLLSDRAAYPAWSNCGIHGAATPCHTSQHVNAKEMLIFAVPAPRAEPAAISVVYSRIVRLCVVVSFLLVFMQAPCISLWLWGHLPDEAKRGHLKSEKTNKLDYAVYFMYYSFGYIMMRFNWAYEASRKWQ